MQTLPKSITFSSPGGSAFKALLAIPFTQMVIVYLILFATSIIENIVNPIEDFFLANKNADIKTQCATHVVMFFSLNKLEKNP